MTKRLVVSAVNLSEGGPLTALRECLEAAASALAPEWEVIALVHDRGLFSTRGIHYIEFPDAKGSWLRRLWYEFGRFNGLCRQLQPNVWLSLHDISPRIDVPRQVVYCHNPSPFYRPSLREGVWDPRFFLFTLFYRYLYRINIHANDLVVVQQDWIRKAFRRLYGVSRVAVAHPVGFGAGRASQPPSPPSVPGVFLYPALPRVFKNFELLCEAAQILEQRVGNVFEVRLTIKGDESKYASYLKRRFSGLSVIRFIGRQSTDEMNRQYHDASAVVFPSRLETWGLPISEAKFWGKPLLVADLPYAHETVGDYDRVSFFDPTDAGELADLMEAHIRGVLRPRPHAQPAPAEPFARSWEDLLRMVVGDVTPSSTHRS